ncbi:MAG TPA: thioesterase family protein [Thermohalobaculum sp.]|nr:thioesterase family protein [Thermohalobaculum sp.]
MKEPAPGRSAYRLFRPITTRWSDNDAYGHINNVRYYAFFDTAVNGWLVEQGFLDIHAGEAINLVVETRCRYFAPLAFPAPLEAGLAVSRLGTSSVTYEIGVFGEGAGTAAAAGSFTHVHVGRDDRRPQPLPAGMRAALGELVRPG